MTSATTTVRRVVTAGAAALRQVRPPTTPTQQFDSPVQRPRDWRKQRAAEEQSRLLTRQERDRILVEYQTCALCTIGIGADHHEKSLYLWYARFVPETDYDFPEEDEDGHLKLDGAGNRTYETYEVWQAVDPLSTDARARQGAAWVRVCGGCAAYKRVPECYRVVAPADWARYRTNQLDLELFLEECQVVLCSAALFDPWREAGGGLAAFVAALPQHQKQGPLARKVAARQARLSRQAQLSAVPLCDDNEEDDGEGASLSHRVVAFKRQAVAQVSHLLGGSGSNTATLPVAL